MDEIEITDDFKIQEKDEKGNVQLSYLGKSYNFYPTSYNLYLPSRSLIGVTKKNLKKDDFFRFGKIFTYESMKNLQDVDSWLNDEVEIFVHKD
jgi:hypothetical protein